ncbi:HTH-type transcriptional regulator cbl [compost metagenome]
MRLFDRSSSGMQATTFCLHIQERCQKVLLETEEIEREANLYRNLESGQLFLGMGRACRELVLRATLPEFVTRHPRIRVQVREGTPDELVYGLKNRQYDMVIAGYRSYQEVEGISWEVLKHISIPVFVRHDHPLANRKGIGLTELAQYPIVSATELSPAHPFRQQVFAEAELNAHVLCSDYGVLGQILLSSDAWAAAPEQQFAREVEEGSLTILDVPSWGLTTELSVIELTGRSRSPSAQRFVELCRANLP